MKYEVEVFRPTDLVAEDSCERDAFEAVWRRMPIGDKSWRGHGVLSIGNERLFVKAIRVGLGMKGRRGRRHWFVQAMKAIRTGLGMQVKPGKRRWGIQREVAAWKQLGDSGLPLAQPVAWGVERMFGQPLRSFLVMDFLDGGVDLEQWLRARAKEVDVGATEPRREVVRRAGELVARLHALGWVHGDLATRNLFVRDGNGEPRFVLIDLAQARRSDGRGWLAVKDLYRLAKTALKAGLTEDEAIELLRPAGGERAREIVERTLQIRTIRSQHLRKLRYQAWLRLGV